MIEITRRMFMIKKTDEGNTFIKSNAAQQFMFWS